MTRKPVSYEGLKEKLFWWTLGAIGMGVIAMVGMVWQLSVNEKIYDYKVDNVLKYVENTNKVANDNYKILSSKADDSTNRSQHRLLMNKLDSLRKDFNKHVMHVMHGYYYGKYGYKLTPDYIFTKH